MLKATKRIAVLTAVTIAAAGGLTASTAASADAATGFARCPKGYFCVFTRTHGHGTMAKYKHGDSNLADRNGPQGMNNNIASGWNRTGKYFGLYSGKYCRGRRLIVWPRDKGTIAPKEDRNVASSIDLLHSPGCGS